MAESEHNLQENSAPENLSKAEARKILGVKPDANKYEIETAYTRKSMSMRHKNDPESLKYIQQITNAYDTLMDNKPIDHSQDKKVFAGKSKAEIKNFWDYGKKPIFAILIAAVLIISIIVSTQRNVEFDLVLSSFGEFYLKQDLIENKEKLKIEKLVTAQNPEINNLRFTNNLISESPFAPASEVNIALTKRMLMLTGADKHDVLVLDKAQYEDIVQGGGLYPLDDLDMKLRSQYPELYKNKIEALTYTLSKDYLPDDWQVQEHIYGLSLSNTQALNSLDLIGKEQILCVSSQSERKQLAKKTIYNLLSSYDEWYDPEQEMYNISEVDKSNKVESTTTTSTSSEN